MKTGCSGRISRIAAVAVTVGTLFGCAGMEVNTKKNAYPYWFIHQELQQADRAVEAARLAGKEAQCPVEFKAAQDLKNEAYSVYAACHTKEGIALAKEAMAKVAALCPPVPAAIVVPVAPPAPPAPVAVAEEAPLEPVAAAEPAVGKTKYCISLNIEYEINKSDVRPQYNDEVANVAMFMKKYPTTTALIEGYSDEVGSDAYNLQLSQRRAEGVVSYLVNKFDIEPARLSAKGYGKAKPVADNATETGRQKNRRINAIIDCALDIKDLPSPPERLCMVLKVEYATNSAEINSAFAAEISKVADYMNKYPTTTALIEGHTDNVGGFDLNMKLSQKRAENVVNYLVSNFGIERSRLSAKGYGYTRRLAYNNTPEGRQKNRRINAIIDCVLVK